jgi:hypothetical protein
MATKAERHRYEDERRSKPDRAPRPPPPKKRRPTLDAGARNLSLHANKSATVVAEESFGKRPSRKSTRKGYLKNNLQLDRLEKKGARR